MKSILSCLFLAGAASAHTIFQQIGINGVMQARYDFMRLPNYDGVSVFFFLLIIFSSIKICPILISNNYSS